MTIGVKEEYRRLGLARQAFKRLLMRLFPLGVSELSLHVLTSNQPAINLYRKLGFQTAAFLPRFYDIDGTLRDAYEMRLSLDWPQPRKPLSESELDLLLQPALSTPSRAPSICLTGFLLISLITLMLVISFSYQLMVS